MFNRWLLAHIKSVFDGTRANLTTTFATIQTIGWRSMSTATAESAPQVNTSQHTHQVQFKTLKNLRKPGLIYSFTDSWHLTKIPPGGVDVQVEYCDTQPSGSSPVILALHGTPGSHRDYTKIINHFGSRYRVLSPNYPDYSLTERTGCFYHSAEERAQLIRDFLRTLDVSTVELLISHSSSVFPASFLWLPEQSTDYPLKIKSLALFNTPGPTFLSPEAEKLLSRFVRFTRFKWFRDFCRRRGVEDLVKKSGMINRVTDFDTIALLWTVAHFSRFQSVADRLEKLAEIRIPTLYLYSQQDKLSQVEVFYQNLMILNAENKHFDVYDTDNTVLQTAKVDDWIQVVNLQSGGHYCYSTHSEIVHRYVEKLLDKVKE